MEVKQLNSDNLTRLGKLQNYLTENYDINVKKVLPKQKLEQAYQNVEKRLVNLRNKSNKFQQDPNYGMNIMVRDALGIMINEGLYYEGETYRKLMDELYEYGCQLAESGDDYDTVMDSCGKKYEAMPARYPKDMVLAAIAEQLMPMFENPLALAGAGIAAGVGGVARGIGGVASGIGGAIDRAGNKDDSVEEDMEDEILDVIDEPEVKIDVDNSEEIPSNFESATEEMLAELIGDHLNKGDWREYTLGELFAELESVDIEKANKVEKMAKKYGITDLKEMKDFESFLDNLVSEMVSEETITEEISGTSVEEAEVVMAARALSNDIQDHIERIGRMANEDIPSIADSMAHEFGAQKAADFKNQMEDLLGSLLDANKSSKEGVDALIGTMTGEESAAPMPAEDPLGGDMMEPAMDEPVDDFAGADAEAGPEEEPLGRAEKI